MKHGTIENPATLDTVSLGLTATGELVINNASDKLAGLGSQGTLAQVLTSAGAGANPTWETPAGGGLTIAGSATLSAATTSTISSLSAGKLYQVVLVGEPATESRWAIRFNADSGANYDWA